MRIAEMNVDRNRAWKTVVELKNRCTITGAVR